MMKKFAFLSLLLLLLFCFCGCAPWYNAVTTEDKVWVYGVSRKDAFVMSYTWDGTDAGKRIVVPDEFDDVPVTHLGGYHGRGVPSPLTVILPKEYDNGNNLMLSDEFFQNQQAVDAWFPNGYEIVEITFTLSLGKNVDSLYYYEGYYYQFAEEGKKTMLYMPVFLFECAEENQTFYAKEGVLYEKATNKVAEWQYS